MGTPEAYISQYSVLTTSTTLGVIVAPFTGDTYDPAIYVRLRNGENPSGASVAMLQSNTYQPVLNAGAFTQVRGLDFLGSTASINRQGDLFEGCIVQYLWGGNYTWSEPTYAVGPGIQVVMAASATGAITMR